MCFFVLGVCMQNGEICVMYKHAILFQTWQNTAEMQKMFVNAYRSDTITKRAVLKWFQRFQGK
jgi:hypothetical protein